MPLEKILIIDEDKNTCTTLKSALEKENLERETLKWLLKQKTTPSVIF